MTGFYPHVSASVIFIIWSKMTFKMSKCLSVSGRPSYALLGRREPSDGRCLCRTGGSCGSTTPSGASCSPSSCWSSCFCGDRRPTTRGRAGPGALRGAFCGPSTVADARSVSVRYAFSPLLDEESEEEEKEPMMNEAFGREAFLLVLRFLSLRRLHVCLCVQRG